MEYIAIISQHRLVVNTYIPKNTFIFNKNRYRSQQSYTSERKKDIFDTLAKQTVAQIEAKRQSALIPADTRKRRAQKNIGYQAYPSERQMTNHIAP